jgi:DNA modification methylase
MVTDPPYEVEYDPAWRQLGWTGARATGKVKNDDRVDWKEAFALFPGDIAYVWHAGVYAGDVAQSLQSCGFELRSQIIWAKQHFVISRGAYHWQHEPCWYAVRKGRTGNWSGDRKQTTLWQIANQSAFGGKKEDASTNHGTQKPVECMRRPIVNHTNPGQCIYDPFLGSGTSIVAAESTGRICFGIDIDPIYVDVAVTRWQNFTGKKAILEGDGKTFEEIKVGRNSSVPVLQKENL